jgi:hypothetical protein
MKNVMLLLLAGVLILLNACNNDCERLRAENDALRSQLNALIGPRSIVLQHLPKKDLITYLERIHTADNIKIPVSFVFEGDTLEKILQHTSADFADTADGIMAYPIMEGDTMKIALVPYYKDGDDFMHFAASDEELGAYNYSQFCPTVCSKNGDILGIGNEMYTFRKCK